MAESQGFVLQNKARNRRRNKAELKDWEITELMPDGILSWHCWNVKDWTHEVSVTIQ